VGGGKPDEVLPGAVSVVSDVWSEVAGMEPNRGAKAWPRSAAGLGTGTGTGARGSMDVEVVWVAVFES
ncbi:MAG TPA: hypothetical protein VF742_08725, partial [Terracidiphilus sp.]